MKTELDETSSMKSKATLQDESGEAARVFFQKGLPVEVAREIYDMNDLDIVRFLAFCDQKENWHR